MVLSSFGMYAADEVTAKVSGTNLSIGLENETSYVAFQMDIKLPEGISASSIEAVANRLSQEGSDQEVGGTKFIIASNVLEGNVLRVIAYNLANAAISNATGDILQIALNAAPASASDIKITNIKFVTATDLQEMALADVTGENGAKVGDVNMDGSVDVLDAARLFNIIVGLAESTPNSDVNGDGSIDVLDAARVFNLIVGL